MEKNSPSSLHTPHSSHSHHHHHEDYASRFKRKSLNSIVFRRKLDKWFKLGLLGVAVFMIILVFAAYLFG